MPLKLLKRTSKQYNVVSKSTFVISVELLDNGRMECTLDAESTGADCLLNISQRLSLHQVEFFGLRYISRGVPPRQRWVELERPLKKQLEKHADVVVNDYNKVKDRPQLSLGVMFYVQDVNLLKDEMARYHYFLQLKSDVIDGKLNCNIDQAISLAAYSLVAEFGDYDPERHTTEYLRDFAILPKELTNDEKYVNVNMDTLHEAVARQYGSLVGFPPPLAEIYYIMVAQQLDGYGQEAYPAKDDGGSDILICVSLNGLVIRRRDWTHVAVFRWSDIKSLIGEFGHKRLFVVEKAQSQRTMQFHFTDPEVAKYVRKMCILQSTFYKQTLPTENPNDNHRSHNFSANQNDQNDGSHLATPDLIAPSLARSTGGSQYSLNNNCFTTSSSSNLSSSGFNLLHHSSAQQQATQQQLTSSQLTSQQQQQHHFHHSLQELPLGRSFTPSLTLMPDLALGTSTSTLSTNMTQHNLNSMNLTPSSDDLQSMQALLPSYRQAPDYETAVQLKYGRGVIPASVTNSTQLYFDGPSSSQNEDEANEPIYQNEIVSQMHSIELLDSLQKSQTRVEGTPPIIAGPSSMSALGTGSTSIEDSQIDNRRHVQNMYKPPPPYPGSSSFISAPKVDNYGTKSSSSTTHHHHNHQTLIQGEEGKVTKDNQSTSETTIISQHRQQTVSEKIGNEAQPQVSPLLTSFKDFGKSSTKSGGSGSSMHGSSVAGNTESSSTSPSQGGKKQLKVKSHNHNEISGSSVVSASTSSSKMGASASTSSISKCKHSDTNVNKRDQSAVKQKQSSVSDSSMDKNKEGKLYGKPIEASVLQEYQSIRRTKSNPNFTTALRRENSKRNRCPNVLPYEDNLIRLSPTKHNPNGYINASPVTSSIGGREWKYIVGQIPLGNGNAPAVWQMIWETEAKIIVVLERDSTAPFYPHDNLSPLNFNDFQISENKERSSIARELTLTYLPKKKEPRKVWILPYEEEWKDDVPIYTEHFLCFLEELNSIQRKVSDSSTHLVVLCGTGAGRSGVLILSDLLLKYYDSGHKLRCDNLLADLRLQRMLLVSSPSQYAFVLHTLAKYLAQSRLI